MAKEVGFAMTVTVDDSAGSGQAISNDVTSLDISTPRGTQDVTGVNKSAVERLQLLSDASITLNGAYNPAANASHDVLSSWSVSSVPRTTVIAISGQTLSTEMWVLNYDLNRAESGEQVWSAPMELQDGTLPTWS